MQKHIIDWNLTQFTCFPKLLNKLLTSQIKVIETLESCYLYTKINSICTKTYAFTKQNVFHPDGKFGHCINIGLSALLHNMAETNHLTLLPSPTFPKQNYDSSNKFIVSLVVVTFQKHGGRSESYPFQRTTRWSKSSPSHLMPKTFE